MYNKNESKRFILGDSLKLLEIKSAKRKNRKNIKVKK